MASFLNLGTNPFSTPVGQRIEQATDGSMPTENWAVNMEICDMINESSDTARDAMKAIRKRLQQNAGKNNQVIMYSLTVLETCVKNCGKAFHVLVAQKDFIQELVKLIGPKNDPPFVVQEKVLNLIQIWADAFKNQPDLNGVTQMYMELKNKGIEFPQTDIENMAPIYTPQRSVPEQPPPQAVTQQAVSPQHAVMTAAGIQSAGPNQLAPEQIAKLHSELEIVSMNMSILGEMLTELRPGQEEPDDYQLLNDLTATCKEMQSRIVDLIGRVTDDELTAELLRINDELNNMFLRHQRYEKNRATTTSMTSPSAVLGAAMGVPTSNAPASNITAPEPKLLDFPDNSNDDVLSSFNRLGMSNTTKPSTKDADEFDMLAQSRTNGGSNKSDLLKDIPTLDATAGSVGSPFKRTGGNNMPVTVKDNEIDEMEAWLGSAKTAEGLEETVTSSEFDKFLEERAAAAENLPTINATNNLDNAAQPTAQPKAKKPEEDLLLL
ncbi:TOM1-like protein 2 isoform X2 [Stomoxys calcitrans]|uniref:TOM1-like protein 2 isoform X2 n=1 Tax=Stomoxys calcitrans TaxID=35570 RepID=UPI0027E28824|nr:TOM1-like protein 2 isoform X2 [Stomoxys calcitrans]